MGGSLIRADLGARCDVEARGHTMALFDSSTGCRDVSQDDWRSMAIAGKPTTEGACAPKQRKGPKNTSAFLGPFLTLAYCLPKNCSAMRALSAASFAYQVAPMVSAYSGVSTAPPTNVLASGTCSRKSSMVFSMDFTVAVINAECSRLPSRHPEACAILHCWLGVPMGSSSSTTNR